MIRLLYKNNCYMISRPNFNQNSATTIFSADLQRAIKTYPVLGIFLEIYFPKCSCVATVFVVFTNNNRWSHKPADKNMHDSILVNKHPGFGLL